jgi:hypothetical protein
MTKTERQEQILEDVLNYKDEIHSAVCTLAGLDAWFATYAASEEFAKLRPEFRKEAVETYTGVSKFLNAVSEQAFWIDQIEKKEKEEPEPELRKDVIMSELHRLFNQPVNPEHKKIFDEAVAERMKQM